MKIDLHNTYFLSFIVICLWMPVLFLGSSITNLFFLRPSHCFIAIFVLYLLFKGKRPNIYNCLLLGYTGMVFLITVYNGGDVIDFGKSMLKTITACLLLQFCMDEVGEKFQNIIKNVLGVMVVINFLLILFFPGGVYIQELVYNKWATERIPWWLFGHKNYHVLWLLAVNILVQLSIAERKDARSYWDYCLFAITLVTPIFIKSSTAVIAMVVASSAFLLQPWKDRIDGKKCTLFVGTSFIALTCFLLNAETFKTSFLSFIPSLFGKDLTFTGRTGAWNKAMQLISMKPWLGYGHLTLETSRKLLGGAAFYHAHNTVLQVMLNGGIVTFSLFCGWLSYLGSRLQELFTVYKERALIIALAFSSVLLVMSFEAWTINREFWLIIILLGLLVENKLKYK